MNNLKNLYIRLDNQGGSEQQSRMIQDKQDTLKRAVQYSYQGAKVQLVNSEQINEALINPNKLLADYDEKIISIDYQAKFKSGDVFKWINPSTHNGDTYWLIYLQDLTELAYFRANVRRCSYQINWKGENGEFYNSYVAIKGPKENEIGSIKSKQFQMDIPNYTLSILMPKTQEALNYFKRYAKFYLHSPIEGEQRCWMVEATDSISTPNILEIYATEYYVNKQEDDLENGIVGGLIEPIISNEQIEEQNKVIVGDNFIKVGFPYTYTYNGSENNEWYYDSDLPIVKKVNNNSITITWTAPYGAQFELYYGNHIKSIVVETLF